MHSWCRCDNCRHYLVFLLRIAPFASGIYRKMNWLNGDKKNDEENE